MSTLAGSGPCYGLSRLGCPDPLGTGLSLALGFRFLSVSLPTRPQKVDDFSVMPGVGGGRPVMAEKGWAGQRGVTLATCGCQEKAVKWPLKDPEH